MITPTDMKRIEKITDKSTTVGERMNIMLCKVGKLLGSKVALVVMGSVLSIMFFFLGLLGRKDQ